MSSGDDHPADEYELPKINVSWKPGVKERIELDRQDRVRRHQIDDAHTPNQVLADYVQETAFKLNLGRTHVQALRHLATPDQAWRCGSSANSSPAMRGLERRGLVTHHLHEGEPPPFGRDAVIWELTTAGKLVVLLLIEAGMLSPSVHGSPLPPPPPDWVDPRPLVDLGAHS